MAGTQNQCVAVAEALGVSFETKQISLKEPWKSLSPFMGFERSYSFSPALHGPWPDLVIASGRKSIAASRYIKRMSKGKSFTVQIQDPRTDLRDFDLVAVPYHDPARGENVIVSDGAPNRVTQARLEAAMREFPQFGIMSSPRVAVLIGGSSKAYTMSEGVTNTLAAQLRGLDAQLMVTSSRRTGAKNEAILRRALPNAYFYDGSGPNPYFAMLAAADYILVTADSASMISDACSSGKPTYMINLEGGHPRIDKLHNHLQDLGALRVFEGNLEDYSYAPLNDAEKISDAIRERIIL
ncbi:MAG: hypothetical protein GW778_07100 [Alphaproteobacteria bacterium]|nr:hypothetical protein [Alphaproteobacteria bacterium]